MRHELEIASLHRRLDAVEDTLGDIAQDVRLSIDYAARDPEGSAAKCGRALEGLLKQLHLQLIGAPPSSAAINKLRNSLDKKLPNVIRTYMDAVQRLRNVGAHHNDDALSTKDAIAVLHAFLLIAEWYAENTRPTSEGRPKNVTTTTQAAWNPLWIVGGVAGALAVAAAGSLVALALTSRTPSQPLPAAATAMSAPELPTADASDAQALLDDLDKRADAARIDLGGADYFVARERLTSVPCGETSAEERARLLEEDELSLEPEPLRDALWLQLQQCENNSRNIVLTDALAEVSQEEIEAAWIITLGLPEAQGRAALDRRHEDALISGDLGTLRAELTGQIVDHIQQQRSPAPAPTTLAPPDAEAVRALHQAPVSAETAAHIALLEAAVFAAPSGPVDSEALSEAALEQEFLAAGCMAEERPQRQAQLMTWLETSPQVRQRRLRDGIADCWGRERRRRAVEATMRWPDAVLREAYIALQAPSARERERYEAAMPKTISREALAGTLAVKLAERRTQ